MSLNDTSTWAPHESTHDLWEERAWFIGICIGAVAYGANATLFFTTLKLLYERPRPALKDNLWILYIVVIFALSTIGNTLQLRVAQYMYIDYRNYPGPLVGWESGNTVAMACNAVYIAVTWMQDSLLLYRFWIIIGPSLILIALPALIFLGTLGVGCTLMFMLTRPGVTIWAKISSELLTAYFSFSISFNIILTLAIVTKLLVTRRRLGKDAIMAPYLSVSAMLIESAALYSVFGIIYFVATELNSEPLRRFLLPIQGQVQALAPMLILMRVAQGRAWSADTSGRATATQMNFKNTHSEQTETGSYPLSSMPTAVEGVSQRATIVWTDSTSRFGDKSSVV